jgi:hypothetical protein
MTKEKSTTIVLSLTEAEASLLYHSRTRSFLNEQRDRFELFSEGAWYSDQIQDGCLQFCGDQFINAKLYSIWADNNGYKSAIFSDEADGSWVVWTDESWDKVLAGAA